YYKDDMFSPIEIEEEEYYLKAMNCPHHHMIYKARPRSYKELPLKLAEYGTVYRYEQSGTLFGLMRVRSLCQNDAHIYCTKDQSENEFLEVLKLHELYYNNLGLTKEDYYILLALPDESKRDKYHGDKSLWDEAESIMRKAIEKSGIRFVEDPGGAAFYGPKIDFNIRSVTGREFGISTNQLDLYMPTRFDLTYTDKDGGEKQCVVIHRAPLGSHERFIGFLIEHFGGNFPVWLSPIQVKIIPIANPHKDYADKVMAELKNSDIRVEVDDRDETMQAKIRDSQILKIPYMFILGDKEKNSGSVTVRLRTGENLREIPLEHALDRVSKAYKTRSLDL
ncbi:threonine--tRNA ligase, partial [candidate division WWE3 bacterium]|nr:threonine--tRNA ligase [candidate division WWE3 bacterium]